MRQIVLDTETTGLNAGLGDRVIEIGCIEIIDRRITGNHFHRYINPERAIEEGAMRVHGISNEFLLDKPRFADIARDWLDFVSSAQLIIHNAAFDVEFLNSELERLSLGRLEEFCPDIQDSLALARSLHPGRKNSLDALCERYAIENSHRTLHGALLDAELLAEVYLAMTRGQETLDIEMIDPVHAAMAEGTREIAAGELLVIVASEQELAEHVRTLESIREASRGRCVWLADA